MMNARTIGEPFRDCCEVLDVLAHQASSIANLPLQADITPFIPKIGVLNMFSSREVLILIE